MQRPRNKVNDIELGTLASSGTVIFFLSHEGDTSLKVKQRTREERGAFSEKPICFDSVILCSLKGIHRGSRSIIFSEAYKHICASRSDFRVPEAFSTTLEFVRDSFFICYEQKQKLPIQDFSRDSLIVCPASYFRNNDHEWNSARVSMYAWLNFRDMHTIPCSHSIWTTCDSQSFLMT